MKYYRYFQWCTTILDWDYPCNQDTLINGLCMLVYQHFVQSHCHFPSNDRVNPITTAGQEVLLVPVPQLEPEDSDNFSGLFRDEDTEDSKSTFL